MRRSFLSFSPFASGYLPLFVPEVDPCLMPVGTAGCKDGLFTLEQGELNVYKAKALPRADELAAQISTALDKVANVTYGSYLSEFHNTSNP